MKILHTIGGFAPSWGGIATCTYDLLSAIHNFNSEIQADLLTNDVLSSNEQLMGDGEGWIKAMPYDLKTPLCISQSIHRFLNNTDYDIYHTNGVWMDVHHQTCAIARKNGKPYVITPHGMLYPEAMKINYWKKWPLLKLWYEKDIREATAIHATCEKEMENVRKLGYQGPIAVIGNPVRVPDYTLALCNARIKDKIYSSKNDNIRRLGYLGRLHPIKKIENILYGMALSMNKSNCHIVIIGTGDSDYERFLHTEAERLGVSNQVEFLGFLNGRDKFTQLSELSALFVTSEMENFGMIVPEALLVGTPVMASFGTPWQSLSEKKCGWWTDNSAESVAKVIDEICTKTPEELLEMGIRGRNYVIDTFSDKAVARQMLQTYQWLLGGEQKPTFVYDA